MDEKTKVKQEKIIDMVSSFCDDKLDEEYKELSIKLVEKMGRKHDVPFKRGRLDIWASAVIYALGQINFLFDKHSKPYASPDMICDYFGTKKSTVSDKARIIRETLKIREFNEEFSTVIRLAYTPKMYIEPKSGLIIPVNQMDVLFDKVYELFDNGEINKAIKLLDTINESNPEYTRALFYKAVILESIKQ